MSLLKRRTPHNLLKKSRETLWPSQGWFRTIRYYRHRLFRTGDSTYKIAGGIALGISLSFVPLLGTHLIQAALIAVAIRANFIAALIGTAAGNPWTFPFLFWLAYKVGIHALMIFGWTEFEALPEFMTREYLMDKPMDFTLYLMDHPMQLFLPMLLGGYVCALFSWPLLYIFLYYPVRQLQKIYNLERTAGRLKKLEKKGNEKKRL